MERTKDELIALREHLETRKLALKAEMSSSDDRSAKCQKLGISFKETYPQDYENYLASNQAYNEVEKELKPIYEELAELEEQEQFKPMEEGL